MHRTSNAFTVLQATAAIVAFAIILWSFGLPSLRFAEAATVTSFSDTLSDSGPSVVSDHTIQFTTPTGVANGQSITVDFSDGPFLINAVDYTDIDVATTSDFTLGPDCTNSEQASAVFVSEVLTITFCTGDGGFIPAFGTTTIQIGLNATFEVAGDARLTNPGVGSPTIGLTAGLADTGETRVAIVTKVVVTASVDTLFTFTVAGVGVGETVNTADATGVTTTATSTPFGLLTGAAQTAAQDLFVSTNARNGFVVTVETDQQLRSSNGADIDSFTDGSFETTPGVWVPPTPVIGDDDTYGHWGITTDDDTLTELLTNPFNVGTGGNRYVSISTTPTEVFRHNGPTNGTGNGQGTAKIGYKVQISALQEAAEDYTATITYVATPVF